MEKELLEWQKIHAQLLEPFPSQNSLPGGSSIAASSSQRSLPYEPASELAASSSQNSLPGCSSLVCSHEEDNPGASLNRCEPSQLQSGAQALVKVQSYHNRWEEAGPCEAVSRLYNSVIMIYLSNINLTYGFDAVFVITLLLAGMLKLWT